MNLLFDHIGETQMKGYLVQRDPLVILMHFVLQQISELPGNLSKTHKEICPRV